MTIHAMNDICTHPAVAAYYANQWSQRVLEDRFDDLDPLIRDLLKDLNKLQGITTIFSCSSHTAEEIRSDKGAAQFYILMTYGPEGLASVHAIHERMRYQHSPCFLALGFTHNAAMGDVLRSSGVPWVRGLKLDMRFRDAKYHVKERSRLIRLLHLEVQNQLTLERRVKLYGTTDSNARTEVRT